MIVERDHHRYIGSDEGANALQRFTIGIETPGRRHGAMEIEQDAIKAAGSLQTLKQAGDVVIVRLVARWSSGATERVEERDDIGVLALAAVDDPTDTGIRTAISGDQLRADRFYHLKLLKCRHLVDEGNRLLQKAGNRNTKARLRIRGIHLLPSLLTRP